MENEGRYLRLRPLAQMQCNYCHGTGKEADGYTCRTCKGFGWV